jgi:hypothetical protein
MNKNLWFMKSVYIIIIVIVVVLAAFLGYKVYHRNHLQSSLGRGAGGGQSDRLDNQQEGTIPQSGDLCGGTGGNGQIVSIGNNVFTLKLNNGNDQTIHLTDQATIKTTAGLTTASKSDLKIGDRVTLVGGPNSDGSFTANGVFVCK